MPRVPRKNKAKHEAEKFWPIVLATVPPSIMTREEAYRKVPHAKMLRAIELLGTRVAPLVRAALASEKTAAPVLMESHAAA